MEPMENRQKKVGIIGGTFDPIHYGHLLIAQIALETFCLDEILFVPSGTPWLKDVTKVQERKTRVSITGIAIEDNPSFALSTIEIDREGNSYSYETLAILREKNPTVDYYFILGADALLEVEKWKSPEKFLGSCTLLASIRNDYDQDAMQKQITYLKDKYGADIRLLPTPRIDISSTMIRNNIKEGKSVRYMLPDKVLRFIQKYHIYEAEED